MNDAAMPTPDTPGQLPSATTSQPELAPAAVAAYVTFYREFIPDLVGFLVWQGARLAEAAELAQEAMIEAHRSWSAIKYPRAWVKRVASRKYARLLATTEEPLEPVNLSDLLCPSIDIPEWEERHEVLRLLNLLPPRQRQVMAWTYDGYSPTEIAAELNISAEAVRTNLKRARRTLSAHLELLGERPQDGGLPEEGPQGGSLPEEGPQEGSLPEGGPQ